MPSTTRGSFLLITAGEGGCSWHPGWGEPQGAAKQPTAPTTAPSPSKESFHPSVSSAKVKKTHAKFGVKETEVGEIQAHRRTRTLSLTTCQPSTSPGSGHPALSSPCVSPSSPTVPNSQSQQRTPCSCSSLSQRNW